MASQDAGRTWRDGEAGQFSELKPLDLSRLVRELKEERLLVPSRQFLQMVQQELQAMASEETDSESPRPRLLTRLIEDVLEYCKLKLLDDGGETTGDRAASLSKERKIAELLERCAVTYSQWLLMHTESEILQSASKSARALQDASLRRSFEAARGSQHSTSTRSGRLHRGKSMPLGFTSANFQEKVKVVPFGVLGTQLRNRADTARGPLPDSSTVVMDWAALSAIQMGPSNSVPLYRWLGIGKEQTYRHEVREELRAEGDVKLYSYHGGEREATVAHTTEPKAALSNGVKRSEVVRALAQIYYKVLVEFAKTELPKLRMTPVTGSVFDGDASQLAETTSEALQAAFGHLNYETQEWIMQETSIELCVYVESEYAGYLRAMRWKQRPTPLSDAAYTLVSRAVQQGMRVAAEGSKFSLEKGGAAQLSSLVEAELACLFRSREFVAGSSRGKGNKGAKIDGFAGASEDESAQLARVEAELGKLIKATTQLTTRLNQEFSQLETRLRRNQNTDARQPTREELEKGKEGAAATAEKPSGAGAGDGKDTREEGDRTVSAASVDALIQGFKSRAPPRRRQALPQAAIQNLVGRRSMMMTSKLPSPQEQLRRTRERSPDGERQIHSARTGREYSRSVGGGVEVRGIPFHNEWALQSERLLHRPSSLYERGLPKIR